MSRKNHEMIDGRLLQTNKKYSQLKLKQKEKIAEWMFLVTRDYYTKKCTFPNDKHLEEVVDTVYEKIEDAEIWIPYGEVFKHYKSKRSNINKRVRKSLNVKEESRIEKVCFMNMCMIKEMYWLWTK
jgi:8-oxo-dGTP diphosphatase